MSLVGVFMVPSVSKAQAVDLTPEARAAIVSQINALLLQLIASLQADLAKLQVSNDAQKETQEEIRADVKKVIENTKKEEVFAGEEESFNFSVTTEQSIGENSPDYVYLKFKTDVEFDNALIKFTDPYGETFGTFAWQPDKGASMTEHPISWAHASSTKNIGTYNYTITAKKGEKQSTISGNFEIK